MHRCDGWMDDPAAVVMFLCGWGGGYILTRYRQDANKNEIYKNDVEDTQHRHIYVTEKEKNRATTKVGMDGESSCSLFVSLPLPVFLFACDVDNVVLLCVFLQEDSNLVDPASSHMLVLKIKPCMSKYKLFIRRNCEWLIKTVIVYLMVILLHG